MKKRHITIAVLLIFSLIVGYIIYYNSINRKISRDLDSDIPITLQFEYEDTHGGFLGDGATIAEAKLEDSHIRDIVEKSERDWMKTPMPLEIQRRVYGNEFEEALIPKVDNGYWTFLDRYRLNNELDTEPNVYYEHTGNYSLGVIDLDTNTLYYIKFDS
ncbi:hypothetical protein EUAN_14750 [Andreesenia angusta]|uniref:Uncharacterized protein n=1 Tax=Andreesenia angusta TaxID=39480 RepID=A0A1S1V791_9FIRM|nr:hypothetical protein [Andreesenia angusta]OHW62027.1 hypothetical protein EUAN_14750 [Andreesenia angusta]